MGALLGVSAFIAISVFFVYKYIVFPSIISPLAKLPTAHPLCAFTSRWFARQCTLMRELKTLYGAHRKYGPIVRIGPEEVSVVSQEGIQKIYVAGLDKDPWYQKTFSIYGVQNLVCTLDHHTHSQVRRTIAGLYTKSYLQRSSDMEILSRRIIFDRFLPKLREFHSHEQNVNVMKLFQWTGVDFITSYIFGTGIGTDFLQDRASREYYFAEWDREKLSSGATYKPITERFFLNMCKAAISSHIGNKTGVETQPLVISKMYKEMLLRAKEWNMSENDVLTRCASEMVDHVIATQETNTITWTYILYRLSLHPDLQLRLESGKELSLPRAADIDKLSLLNAVVFETLRLHTANPARMRRVVPSGGLNLHGHHIPQGTTVSTNAYCLHRNEAVFPNPSQWIPERWMMTDRKRFDSVNIDTMWKWFWAFGSGPRMCIGQNFAVQVIKLVIAAVYSQYTTSIVNDEGIEQSDSYNSGPISNRLILRFHDADEIRTE
ncbi:hypothetical protein M433DRAFT_542149 [Acidomyces richmondensis BFW]|nr:hypothetical protein M433DRAFT_542149 [Acidomyces richmondensis BFW]